LYARSCDRPLNVVWVVWVVDAPIPCPFIVSWDSVFTGSVPIVVVWFVCLIEEVPIVSFFGLEEFYRVPLIGCWVEEVIPSVGTIGRGCSVKYNGIPDCYWEVV
jgi:hypothetical protein